MKGGITMIKNETLQKATIEAYQVIAEELNGDFKVLANTTDHMKALSSLREGTNKYKTEIEQKKVKVYMTIYNKN